MLCLRKTSTVLLIRLLGIQRFLSSSFRIRAINGVTNKDVKKLSPQEANMEAARVALQSFKDMGSLFSSGSEEAVQPIDTKPIVKHPELFSDLNILHQGQVVQELQAKFDGNWKKLANEDKKLAYYVYYGNWGPREKFLNWDERSAPLDLPFTVPSVIKNISPKPDTVVHKLEPVILGETEVRKGQFDTSKTDPMTKALIYFVVFIAIVAIARDKKIGEKGKPIEPVWEVPHQKEREQEEETAEAKRQAHLVEQAIQEQAKENKRHWYYLLLK